MDESKLVQLRAACAWCEEVLHFGSTDGLTGSPSWINKPSPTGCASLFLSLVGWMAVLAGLLAGLVCSAPSPSLLKLLPILWLCLSTTQHFLSFSFLLRMLLAFCCIYAIHALTVFENGDGIPPTTFPPKWNKTGSSMCISLSILFFHSITASLHLLLFFFFVLCMFFFSPLPFEKFYLPTPFGWFIIHPALNKKTTKKVNDIILVTTALNIIGFPLVLMPFPSCVFSLEVKKSSNQFGWGLWVMFACTAQHKIFVSDPFSYIYTFQK